MKKLFFLAVSVCTILSSCSSKSEVPEPTPDPTPGVQSQIPINLSISNHTRANDDTFETDDEVGVYVVNYTDGTAGTLALSGNQADNMRFTFRDNAWIPDNAIYWKDNSTPADIIVYYPYAETVSSVTAHPFSVQTDQSTASNFWASDFLWGKATNVSPTFSAIPITTNHSLSRIILNLQPGDGYTTEDWAAAEKSVCITNVKTSATIDLSNGVATATGEATNVTPFKVSESNNTICYQAMMIPQELTDAATLITATIDGKEYTISPSITLKPRTQHGFNLKINKETGELELSIGEWETEYTDLSNKITYTTTDGNVLEFFDWGYEDVEIFGAKIASNNYSNGQGEIIFDGGISKIGVYAFRDCSNLLSINLPDGVTQIGGGAFYGCSNLSSIDIPDGVTHIGNGAFSGCTELDSVNIPDSVIELGTNPFDFCSVNLIITGKYVTDDGNAIIEGERLVWGNHSLKTYDIPANVKQIDYAAFRYSSLESVNIPNGVTIISRNAFANSYDLKDVSIPDGVTIIGSNAFQLTNIENITIPETIEYIDPWAFDIYALQTVNCLSATPPIVGDYIFGNAGYAYSLSAIYVPTEAVDAYKAADGWEKYANMIVGSDFSE